MPSQRQREQLTPARIDEILDTASRLFASSGLRTSLQEIADACGIQPGSLYHHFESKEAIVVQLVRRYHAELDGVAEAARKERPATDAGQASKQIVKLAKAIAHCAVRHSAAVQFTFYEPPAGASRELSRLASRPPSSIQSALLDTLVAGRAVGFIRPDLDLETLADRMCQTMLHVGLVLFHRYRRVDETVDQLCQILLHGLAGRPPVSSALDRSAALAAVDRVIEHWDDDDRPEDDRATQIRTVARREFGRRGYEVTTIRDVAAAAGMSTGSVYRVIGSKDELLASIMLRFAVKVADGWNAAILSDSSPSEKLDALAWLHINVVDQFNDEFKIQLAWMRQSPPDTPDLGWSLAGVLKQLRAELADGARSGELRISSPSAELTARCVLELIWIPENIVRAVGKRAALEHARDTLLLGAATR